MKSSIRIGWNSGSHSMSHLHGSTSHEYSRILRADPDEEDDLITSLRVASGNNKIRTSCPKKITDVKDYEIHDVSDGQCYSYEAGQPLSITWKASKGASGNDKLALYWVNYNPNSGQLISMDLIGNNFQAKSQRIFARLPDKTPLETVTIPAAMRDLDQGKGAPLYLGSPVLLIWPQASSAVILSDIKPYYSVYILTGLLSFLVVCSAIFLVLRNVYINTKRKRSQQTNSYQRDTEQLEQIGQ